ncbi:hypothetical protein JL09_g6810, partial [Pichia kudriavzevii]
EYWNIIADHHGITRENSISSR